MHHLKYLVERVESGGQVKLINVKSGADNYSRKDIDALGEFAALYGAKGLAWLKVTEEGLTVQLRDFFEGESATFIATGCRMLKQEILLLFVADKRMLLQMH